MYDVGLELLQILNDLTQAREGPLDIRI